MLAKYKNLLSVLFLTGISVASVFFVFHNGLNNQIIQTQDRINSYMLNATYDQYNEKGEQTTHVTATKADHYNMSDSYHFENPVIFLYAEKEAPWKITADYGKTLSGSHKIDLWQNVVLHQDGFDKKEETTIRTTALSFNTNTQEAETNQAVTIIQPHSIVQSVGLRTNLKSGVSQLSANARVVYDGTK